MDDRIPLYYVYIHLVHCIYIYIRTGWTVHICKWIVGFHCTHPGHGTIGQCVFQGKLISTHLKI